MKIWRMLVLFMLLTPVARADDIDARARDLGRQLRCLVCQGESVEESSADFARDIRTLVREQIAAGKTDEDILTFLRARYGDFILLNPPVEGKTALLWLMPLIVLGGGVVVARRWMQKV